MKKILKKLLRPLILELLKEGIKSNITIDGNLNVSGTMQCCCARTEVPIEKGVDFYKPE